ncbi:hypothetical protein PsorP6_009903 [Peronosclerospora sorghi]|uniref:Uncharacterized protein n=1 Tax=Peronosclerospora sorghi TaxID=230839 RepID=A0ACC0VXS1_9STRA|nr:hypothetical protein PsorP6_009903 [Peronosclerospora sorghi]
MKVSARSQSSLPDDIRREDRSVPVYSEIVGYSRHPSESKLFRLDPSVVPGRDSDKVDAVPDNPGGFEDFVDVHSSLGTLQDVNDGIFQTEIIMIKRKKNQPISSWRSDKPSFARTRLYHKCWRVTRLLASSDVILAQALYRSNQVCNSTFLRFQLRSDALWIVLNTLIPELSPECDVRMLETANGVYKRSWWRSRDSTSRSFVRRVLCIVSYTRPESEVAQTRGVRDVEGHWYRRPVVAGRDGFFTRS